MKPPTSIPSTSSTTSSFVPVAGHGPAGSAIETMVSFAQQATSDKTSLPHFIPDTSSQSQTKRPHSPFSDDEKDANGASPSGTSIEERQLKRRRKVKPGTSRSSISDSNMSKYVCLYVILCFN